MAQALKARKFGALEFFWFKQFKPFKPFNPLRYRLPRHGAGKPVLRRVEGRRGFEPSAAVEQIEPFVASH